MKAYIRGAGAHAGYPLTSGLLKALSEWLESADASEHWVGACRNRIVQVRETFGQLDDFEGILGRLDECGFKRVNELELVRPDSCGNPMRKVQVGLRLTF